MNYILEDGINFQDELLKALCEEKSINTENSCLITNEPLGEESIKLDCGHSYNYDPLMKEIIKQKRAINSLETQRLASREIKCPYCRTVQKNVLPYRQCDEKMYGINWPQKWALYRNRCKTILKGGKRRNQVCNKPCWKNFCCSHTKQKPTKIQETKVQFCQAILKTGKRKGEKCGVRARKRVNNKWVPCNFCGRHRKKQETTQTNTPIQTNTAIYTATPTSMPTILVPSIKQIYSILSLNKIM